MVWSFSPSSPGALGFAPERALLRIPGILKSMAPAPRRKPAAENAIEETEVFNDAQRGRAKQMRPATATAMSNTAKSILLKKPKPAKKAARKAYWARRRRHQRTAR